MRISITGAAAVAGLMWYLQAAPAGAQEVRAGDLVIAQAWSAS